MHATPSQTIGPFFHVCLAEEPGGCLAGLGAEGGRITLICRVLDADAQPVNDALVELWQPDAEGIYNHPDDPRYDDRDPAFAGFGRLPTNEQGACSFQTVMPGPARQEEAPHIDVSLFARGLLKRAVTRIYFQDHPANAVDPALALLPAARRETLIARPDPAQSSIWRFDIHLSGDRETVFFQS